MEPTSETAIEQRRAALRTTRRIATLLLFAMAALFVLSFSLEGVTPLAPWIRAFAEAAMVGALADWFAVVALFRHPLGLPFPHTAIIPRSKARLGRGLGEFVQSNFLSEAVIAQKLASLEPAARIAAWCESPNHQVEMARAGVQALRSALTALSDEAVQSIGSQLLDELVRKVPLSRTAGILLFTALERDQEGGMVDQILRISEYILTEHSDFLERMLGTQLPWYVPWFVHDAVYQKVIHRLREQIAAISADPGHPTRALLRAEGLRLAHRWQHSEEAAATGKRIIELLLANEGAKEFIRNAGSRIRLQLIQTLEAPNSEIELAAAKAIGKLSTTLSASEKLRHDLDGFLIRTSSALVKGHASELRSLITDTVNSWDTQTIVEKIELEVGRDLNFVRINGTIVGGIVGLAIYAIARVLS